MSVSWDVVDEGLPIAYQMLGAGVPVLASDGEQVGTVGSVLSAPDEDIFHGVTPEPSSFWMMAGALAIGLAAFRYRHKLPSKR